MALRTLRTPRLQLRQATPRGVEKLTAAQPDLQAGMSEAASRWVATLGDVSPEVCGAWLVCRGLAGLPIGLFAYQTPARGEGVEISYMVSAVWRGRGFASESVGAAIAYLNSTLRIRSLFADVAVDNVASQAILRRNGFRLDASCAQALTVGLQCEQARRWRRISEPY